MVIGLFCAALIRNWLAVIWSSVALWWWYSAWVNLNIVSRAENNLSDMRWAMHTALRHADPPSQEHE
jgi:hypothetical protein